MYFSKKKKKKKKKMIMKVLSRLSHLCHFKIILGNHLKVLNRTFLFVNRLSKNNAACFATNSMLNCAKKIFHLDLNSYKISAKNHCENPLSHTRKHT